jgi:hypothetical protein
MTRLGQHNLREKPLAKSGSETGLSGIFKGPPLPGHVYVVAVLFSAAPGAMRKWQAAREVLRPRQSELAALAEEVLADDRMDGDLQ